MDEDEYLAAIAEEERLDSAERSISTLQSDTEQMKSSIKDLVKGQKSILEILNKIQDRLGQPRTTPVEEGDSDASTRTHEDVFSAASVQNKQDEMEDEGTPFPRGSGPLGAFGAPSVEVPRLHEGNVKDPAPFKGERSRTLEDFLADVVDIFRTHPATYYNDSLKVGYVGTLLEENPKRWYRQITKQPESTWPAFMNNWDDFVKELKLSFGDPDPLDTRTQEFINLKQTHSAAAYKAEFESRAHALGINISDTSDRAEQFFNGLKPRVRDYINTHEDKPHKYHELADLAVKIDTRLTRAWLEKNKNADKKDKDKDKNGDNKGIDKKDQSSSGKRAAPHETDNSQPSKKFKKGNWKDKKEEKEKKKGGVSAQERKRRFKEGLCLDCGKPGHIAKDCPEKADNKGDKAKSQTPTASQSKGSKNHKA